MIGDLCVVRFMSNVRLRRWSSDSVVWGLFQSDCKKKCVNFALGRTSMSRIRALLGFEIDFRFRFFWVSTRLMFFKQSRGGPLQEVVSWFQPVFFDARILRLTYPISSSTFVLFQSARTRSFEMTERGGVVISYVGQYVQFFYHQGSRACFI